MIYHVFFSHSILQRMVFLDACISFSAGPVFGPTRETEGGEGGRGLWWEAGGEKGFGPPHVAQQGVEGGPNASSAWRGSSRRLAARARQRQWPRGQPSAGSTTGCRVPAQECTARTGRLLGFHCEAAGMLFSGPESSCSWPMTCCSSRATAWACGSSGSFSSLSRLLTFFFFFLQSSAAAGSLGNAILSSVILFLSFFEFPPWIQSEPLPAVPVGKAIPRWPCSRFLSQEFSTLHRTWLNAGGRSGLQATSARQLRRPILSGGSGWNVGIPGKSAAVCAGSLLRNAVPGAQSACRWGRPSRVMGLTKVASTAISAPCPRGRPDTRTSMARLSWGGWGRFIARRGALMCPRPPASRQLRATARSRGMKRIFLFEAWHQALHHARILPQST